MNAFQDENIENFLEARDFLLPLFLMTQLCFSVALLSATVFENHRKKSHSTLRAKRATQKLVKNAKNGPFWRFFENLKLAVKQCYQTGQF